MTKARVPGAAALADTGLGKLGAAAKAAEADAPAPAKAPASPAEDEWLGLMGMDAFPGQDRGVARNLEGAKKLCRQHGFGGFVWCQDCARQGVPTKGHVARNVKMFEPCVDLAMG